MDRTEVFKYTTLQPGQFRLLVLLPGSESDDLVINLTTEHFDSINQYGAISYSWGNSEKPESLLCRSQTSMQIMEDDTLLSIGRIPITTNVYHMLRSLRSIEDYCIFWIDAICINQDDVDEKTTQVQMMHRIYSKARITILYAGECDEDTVAAFQCIKLLGKLKEIPSYALGTVFEHSCKGFQSPRGPESYASLLEAFLNLLSRSWFKRAWVMQEIVLSSRKRFHCGRLSIQWGEVVDACKVMVNGNIDLLLSGNPGEPSGRMVCRYSELEQYWSNLRHVQSDLRLPDGVSRETIEQNAGPALAFLAILVLARNLDATDARDKIFAISNMVYGYSRAEMPEIDYNNSVAELYTCVALSWAEHHGGLQFLNCVQHTTNTHGLPSWVPDWSQPWNDMEPHEGPQNVLASIQK